MTKLSFTLLFLSSLLFTNNILANSRSTQKIGNQNLLVIQKVSADKKSFIIRRGMQDQIYSGQRSLFSSKNISFVARAIAVDRNYSQWVLEDEQANVPFEIGEIITISYSIERVWSEIPKLLTDQTYKKMLAEEEKLLLKRFGNIYFGRFQILGSKSQTFTESTTESENNDGDRSGYNFKLKYSKPMTDAFRFEIGFRYDAETLILTDPAVEEETQRYYLTAGVQARFPNLWGFDSIPYASMRIGYGNSQSQINSAVRSGSALLLPSFTLGVDMKMNDKSSLLLEATLESLSATENFDDGVEQKTSINAGHISIGIEFL